MGDEMSAENGSRSPAGSRSRPVESQAADVVVVGAGLAGLMTGRALLRAGLQPLVLEARDRVGGRVVNEPIGDGKVVEMGGQWVAPRDEFMRGLGVEFGIEFFPTYDDGTHLLEVSGQVRRYRGAVPRLRPAHHDRCAASTRCLGDRSSVRRDRRPDPGVGRHALQERRRAARPHPRIPG